MSGRSDEHDERYHKRQEREEAHRRQLPTDDEVPLPPPAETIRGDAKVKRNDPCPCGSGKKYKQCCVKKQGEAGE